MSDTIDTFLDETLKPLGRLRGATTEESSILQKVDFETAKASIKQFIENRAKEADETAMFREARHRATDAIDRLWRLDKDACREFLKTYVGESALTESKGD